MITDALKLDATIGWERPMLSVDPEKSSIQEKGPGADAPGPWEPNFNEAADNDIAGAIGVLFSS